MQVLATLFREVAGENPQQLVQIRAQGAVGCLLNTEVFEHRHAARGADAPRGGPQQLLVHPAVLRIVTDRYFAQRVAHGVDAMHVLREKCFVTEAFLNQNGGQSGQTPRVGTRPHPQVEVGHLRGVGEYRVDHDHRPRRVFGDLVEHHPRPRETLRHPRVLPDEHRHLGLLELTACVAAVQMRIDPRFARFLLRQRIGTVARPEGLQECAAIGSAQMVALPAAAIVEDLVSTVGVADVLESFGDLDNRCVPVDLLVASVCPSSHRRGQPGAVVLVVVQPQRLVAGVALRTRMLLVAPDAGQRAILDLHDDAAVAFAQDACGRLPISGHRGDPFLGPQHPEQHCAAGGERHQAASGRGAPGPAGSHPRSPRSPTPPVRRLGLREGRR